MLRIADLKGKALDFLFPRWCVGCGGEGQLICHSCFDSLTPIMGALCPRCGRPQSNHDNCHEILHNLDGIRAPYTFQGAMRQAVHELKYNNVRIIAPELAQILADYLSLNPLPADLIVPVPLHDSRLRERGYNQSGLLAKNLSQLTGIPFAENGLVRTRPTIPQARTGNREERLQNLRDAFTYAGDCFKGRHVLIIDDVSTSGATLEACATAARLGGAATVWGLVPAREI